MQVALVGNGANQVFFEIYQKYMLFRMVGFDGLTSTMGRWWICNGSATDLRVTNTVATGSYHRFGASAICRICIPDLTNVVIDNRRQPNAEMVRGQDSVEK
jgi:hypothetical protein